MIEAKPNSAANGVPRVLLASRSPRRRALLTEFGIEHDADHPGFEDSGLSPGGVSPREWVASLAYLKAWAKASGLLPDQLTIPCIVLGADTTCLQDGRMVGTPHDAAGAGEMLRSLSCGTHDVLTGVALIRLDLAAPRERVIFVDSATVRVGELSDAMIEEYVDSGGWQGKAGGYNLAERLEAGWPLEYIGDPTTIMGLPMRELIRRLSRMGVVSTFARPDLPSSANPGV